MQISPALLLLAERKMVLNFFFFLAMKLFIKLDKTGFFRAEQNQM